MTTLVAPIVNFCISWRISSEVRFFGRPEIQSFRLSTEGITPIFFPGRISAYGPDPSLIGEVDLSMWTGSLFSQNAVVNACTVMTGNTIFNERIVICVVLVLLCYPSQQCPAVTTAFSETRDPVHIRDPSHPRVIKTRCGNSPGKVLLQKYFETTNFEKLSKIF